MKSSFKTISLLLIGIPFIAILLTTLGYYSFLFITHNYSRDFLKIDSCLDSGGRWDYDSCEYGDGLFYKKISWADFKRKIDPSLDFYAVTYWQVSYNYDNPVFEGNIAKVKIRVTYGLEKTSWYKPDEISDRLLQHEQGHLNIAYLLGLELQRTYDTSRYSRENYKNEIDSIFNTLKKKYLAMEILYDKETNHMYNTLEQKKWEDFLENNIEQIKWEDFLEKQIYGHTQQKANS